MKRLTLLLMAACALPVMCLADLHDPNNAADYMIVTTQQLINDYPWINQLAEWRNEHGRTAMVVATDSIWEEFGTGVPSDTVLKTFLHYTYENWQEPQLKDVFVIGFHDVVPSHVEQFSDTSYYLSDFYYTFPPESTYAAPVISIGRLPWSPTQLPILYDYYEKIHSYETVVLAPWQTRVHVIADFGDNIFDFPTWIEEAIVSQIGPGYDVERDYLGVPDEPWHGDRESILVNLDSGSYFVIYVGFSGFGYWSDSLRLDSSDYAQLTNSPRLPIVIGMSLDVSMNDFEVSGIPTSFLSNQLGGAIAYFAGTGITYAGSGMAYRSILTRLTTSDSVSTLGDVWQMTAAVFVRSGGFPITVRANMLFGDPGLVLPPRPTAAGDEPKPLPEDIRLLGNYPNPFNASTEIHYELNRSTQISLKVYDVLGREAAALVDELQAAGIHAVQWNAQSASSGVYFAVLQAGGKARTIKMMMLK